MKLLPIRSSILQESEVRSGINIIMLVVIGLVLLSVLVAIGLLITYNINQQLPNNTQVDFLNESRQQIQAAVNLLPITLIVVIAALIIAVVLRFGNLVGGGGGGV